MGFGPDGSIPSLINNQVGRVIVPNGKRAVFNFASDANWENSVCIYPEGSEQLLVEAGNYRRPLSTFTIPENNTGGNTSYIVTGWHKQGESSGRRPWIQSTMLEHPYMDGHTYNFGFEDAGDGDFNDMYVTVDIID